MEKYRLIRQEQVLDGSGAGPREGGGGDLGWESTG